MTAANENVTENAVSDGEEAPRAPLGLKILVVALGLAILVVLGLIIFKVMAGDHKKAKASREAQVAASTLSPSLAEVESGAIFDLSIVRPAGSSLVSTSVTSAEIVLTFKAPDADTIVVINRATGKESRLTVPK
jgi:hypothetical protein